MAEEMKNVEVKEQANAPVDAKAGKKAPSKDGRNFKGGKKTDRRVKKDNAPKEFEERVVSINRVTKVVKGGKRMKFAALVVIGNGKGKYGFGTGKSSEVPDAIKKAVDKAKRNLFTVDLVKNGTITHEVTGKFGATTVFLKPANEGTGIIAGGAVRSILELAGVKNVCSKVYGSRTKINVIRATNNALSSTKNYKSVMSLRKGDSEDVK